MVSFDRKGVSIADERSPSVVRGGEEEVSVVRRTEDTLAPQVASLGVIYPSVRSELSKEAAYLIAAHDPRDLSPLPPSLHTRRA
jgi:hypothetical protein